MRLNKLQLIVVVGGLLLTGGLLSLDIANLAQKKAEAKPMMSQQATESASLDFEMVEKASKAGLDKATLSQVENLEKDLASASQGQKATLLEKLSQRWGKSGNVIMQALYQEKLAEERSSDYVSWQKTGDLLLNAIEASRDSVQNRAVYAKAKNAFEKALSIDKNSLEAKTGLGVVYVAGTNNPMQGISLLLDVVKQNPKHVKANMNLGLFSVRSGQYQKAVHRFEMVNKIAPSAESYFYLAESYKGLGDKEKAIVAYGKCKEMMTDLAFRKAIDGFITELKN